MENRVTPGPHQVAYIKECQKKAWTCALSSFFQLDLKGVSSDETDNRLRAAWKEYLTTEELTTQEALEQKNNLLIKYSSHFPYSPGYPDWFGRLWESISLADMEALRLSCRPPSPDPYNTAILWERINELADKNAPGTTTKIARLHAAITWFGGSEQRLAMTQSELAPVGTPVAASSPAPTPPQANEPALEESSRLSLRQIALQYVYEGKVIVKTGADKLARREGYTSGAKLYDHYRTVSQRAGRVGEEIIGQKLVPMITDITAVIPTLSDAAKQQAGSELQTLKARKEEK